LHLQLLGTAAAEGWPAVFCGCDTCSRARAAGGKDLRSRSSLLIDGVYKIDLPPDTYYHSVRHNIQFSQLECIFFTHSHEDHLDPGELSYLRPPFAHNLTHTPINIYGNRAVLDAIERFNAKNNLPVSLIEARPFNPIKAGNLTFVPVKAEHKPDEEALNYVIGSSSATALYASDTGRYETATIEHLAGYHFDLLISECTQGMLGLPAKFHMGLEAVLELRDKLDHAGALKAGARTVITHFSHNIGLLHEELEAVANPHGIIVAYDGISFDV